MTAGRCPIALLELPSKMLNTSTGRVDEVVANHGPQAHSPLKPTLIFVSSRRQTRLTALDVIAFAAADERAEQFVHMPEDELQDVLANIRVRMLARILAETAMSVLCRTLCSDTGKERCCVYEVLQDATKISEHNSHAYSGYPIAARNL